MSGEVGVETRWLRVRMRPMKREVAHAKVMTARVP
jgi:hypothetical protein